MTFDHLNAWHDWQANMANKLTSKVVDGLQASAGVKLTREQQDELTAELSDALETLQNIAVRGD